MTRDQIAHLIAEHVEISDATIKAAGGVACVDGIGKAADAIFAAFEHSQEQLRDALRGLLDWVEEGCPDGGAYAAVEAKAALANIRSVVPAPPVAGPLADKQTETR